MIEVPRTQMNRRSAMGIIGFLAFLATLLPRRTARALARSERRATTPTRGLPPGADRARLAGPAVRAYFGDVVPGTRVGDATIASVHDVHLGAIPVVLRLASGRSVQVDLVRPSAVVGVASSGLTTAHLVNSADGSSPTHETAGLSTMALARLLAVRESTGARPPALLTHEERAARFPRGRFHV